MFSENIMYKLKEKEDYNFISVKKKKQKFQFFNHYITFLLLLLKICKIDSSWFGSFFTDSYSNGPVNAADTEKPYPSEL